MCVGGGCGHGLCVNKQKAVNGACGGSYSVIAPSVCERALYTSCLSNAHLYKCKRKWNTNSAVVCVRDSVAQWGWRCWIKAKV